MSAGERAGARGAGAVPGATRPPHSDRRLFPQHEPKPELKIGIESAVGSETMARSGGEARRVPPPARGSRARPKVVIPSGMPSKAEERALLTGESEHGITASSTRARRSARLDDDDDVWAATAGCWHEAGDGDGDDAGGDGLAGENGGGDGETASFDSGCGAYVSLLRRNAAFRWLLVGGFVTGLGTWFNEVATLVVLQRYTSSAFMVSLYFIIRLLASALFSPVAGVVVDSVPKIKLLLGCDVASTVLVCGYLLVTSSETLWIVYVNVVLIGILSALFRPSKTALVAEMVAPGEDLELANALDSMINSLTFALGSAGSGLVTGLLGTAPAYIFDASSFAFSAGCMVMVMQLAAGGSGYTLVVDSGSASADDAAGDGDSEWAVDTDTSGSAVVRWAKAYAAGLSFVFIKRPLLGVLAVIMAGFKFADAANDLVMTRLVQREYSMGKSNSGLGLGLSFVAVSIGIVLGPFAMRRIQASVYAQVLPLDGRLAFMQAGIGLAGIGFFVVALDLHVAAYMGAMCLVGVGISFMWVQAWTTLQELAIPAIRGRVLSTASSLRLLFGLE
ncbi:major facilitator superfamily transporter MFS_1 [Thecamonas trahens ATCC 50062]|uniref:Major facilitator superfamily transporter MFS_1 n=1 Tax=Thecamonas trahens ATCC 50062 TaxID=461836 RepID=A0A0L0D576_THETB|nr:major facilitator superfamily transporter MFS_1 [Thecamonas trahens ATCC 50062]KNC47489.1 major facilitator superfamily transporter MFS_1 [Thecamonas trahens ATCC 50062]|eukprot:XP_013759425.1 major facilitator superfamily transporter MFS_1 [Thecamonas trahens ATCC 50062]